MELAATPPTTTCPPIPPAEDWIRTPLLEASFLDREPAEEGILFTAATRSRSGHTWGDQRAWLTDFVPLGSERTTSFEDAVRGAGELARKVTDGNVFIVPKAVGLLRGRDGSYWGVPLIQGDGSETIAADKASRPTLKYGVSWDRIEGTGKLRDLFAVTDGHQFVDTRSDVNGSWSWDVQSLPVAPPADPPA